MGRQSSLKRERRLIREGIPPDGSLPPWTKWAPLPDTDFGDPDTWQLIRQHANDVASTTGITYATALANVLHRMKITHVQNSRYHVAIDQLPGQEDLIHLDVRRRDNLPMGPEHFRDLQRIKNELVGPEHDSYERYPPESQLRDAGNNYHLWVFKDPAVRLPGFSERLVRYGSSTWSVGQNVQASAEV